MSDDSRRSSYTPVPRGERKRASVLTAEVMQEISGQRARSRHVESVASSRPKRGGAAQDIVFVLSMLGCLVLTGLNVTGRMPFQTVASADAEDQIERMAYQAVNFAVREINEFRRRNGELPETLTDVGAPTDPRWIYEVVGSDYVVRFDFEGFPVAYDSRRDPDEFFASVRRGQ